jgi:hypothetical protein
MKIKVGDKEEEASNPLHVEWVVNSDGAGAFSRLGPLV